MGVERAIRDALERELLARRAGAYTGTVTLVINMHQGGVTNASIAATKRLPLKRDAR